MTVQPLQLILSTGMKPAFVDAHTADSQRGTGEDRLTVTQQLNVILVDFGPIKKNWMIFHGAPDIIPWYLLAAG